MIIYAEKPQGYKTQLRLNQGKIQDKQFLCKNSRKSRQFYSAFNVCT